MKSALWLLIAVILFPAGAEGAQAPPQSAQVPAAQPAPPPSGTIAPGVQPAPSPAEAAGSNAALEIALLRQSVAQQEQFQSDLLSTVYWALGTVAGIALLLTGVNVISAFQIRRRDKRELLQHVTRTVRKLFADHAQSQTQSELDERERIDDKLSSLREEIEADRLRDADARKTELQTAVQELKTSATKRFEALERFSRRAVMMQRFDTAHLAWRLHGGAKMHSAAITSALTMLEVSLDLMEESDRASAMPYPYARWALDAILESATEKGKFAQYELDKFLPLIERLPPNLTELGRKAKEAVENNGVFPDLT